MMTILEQFENKLRKNPKTIIFPEGSDPRILEAASRLLASNFLFPILLGKEEEILASAEEVGFNIKIMNDLMRWLQNLSGCGHTAA